jgi:hypothetical protein
LERESFSVWWDQVTETALREAKAVVVLWSKKSIEALWIENAGDSIAAISA